MLFNKINIPISNIYKLFLKFIVDYVLLFDPSWASLLYFSSNNFWYAVLFCHKLDAWVFKGLSLLGSAKKLRETLGYAAYHSNTTYLEKQYCLNIITHYSYLRVTELTTKSFWLHKEHSIFLWVCLSIYYHVHQHLGENMVWWSEQLEHW